MYDRPLRKEPISDEKVEYFMHQMKGELEHFLKKKTSFSIKYDACVMDMDSVKDLIVKTYPNTSIETMVKHDPMEDWMIILEDTHPSTKYQTRAIILLNKGNTIWYPTNEFDDQSRRVPYYLDNVSVYIIIISVNKEFLKHPFTGKYTMKGAVDEITHDQIIARDIDDLAMLKEDLTCNSGNTQIQKLFTDVMFMLCSLANGMRYNK